MLQRRDFISGLRVDILQSQELSLFVSCPQAEEIVVKTSYQRFFLQIRQHKSKTGYKSQKPSFADNVLTGIVFKMLKGDLPLTLCMPSATHVAEPISHAGRHRRLESPTQ